jgi:hypothetical protein
MIQSALGSKGLLRLAGAVRLASSAGAIRAPPRAVELFDPPRRRSATQSLLSRQTAGAFPPGTLAAGSPAADAAVSPYPETSIAPGSAKLLAEIAAIVGDARVLYGYKLKTVLPSAMAGLEPQPDIAADRLTFEKLSLRQLARP